jgi:hypothetical protein
VTTFDYQIRVSRLPPWPGLGLAAHMADLPRVVARVAELTRHERGVTTPLADPVGERYGRDEAEARAALHQAMEDWIARQGEEPATP